MNSTHKVGGSNPSGGATNDVGNLQKQLRATRNQRDEALRSARYQRFMRRCVGQSNRRLHEQLRTLGNLYEETKIAIEGYEAMIGWLFREFVPDDSKPHVLHIAPLVADAVSACNHEPGEDFPAHPMTVANQRPVSAVEAAAIDKAAGVVRQLNAEAVGEADKRIAELEQQLAEARTAKTSNEAFGQLAAKLLGRTEPRDAAARGRTGG